MITKEVVVSGYVQGVGYRYFARKNANVFGIAGYAENKPDGSVKVVAQGDSADIKAFIEALSVGPVASSVDSIVVITVAEPKIYQNFEVY